MFLGPEALKQLKSVGDVATIGIEMAVSICVGFFGGMWLDGKLGTAPWLQWIGLSFGIVAGFRSLYKLAKKYQKQLREPPEDPPEENDATPTDRQP